MTTALPGWTQSSADFSPAFVQSGMLSNTWVVITSDHGEHFGEHGQFGHGSSLYNEITHVPLILIPPLGSGGPRMTPRRPCVAAGSARQFPLVTWHGQWPPWQNRTVPIPSPAATSLATGRATATIKAPVFSQLIEPRLQGEDFRTENLNRIETLIDEDRILIETDSRNTELFHLSRDTRQVSNLADDPAEQARLARLKSKLTALRSELEQPTESRRSDVPGTY